MSRVITAVSSGPPAGSSRSTSTRTSRDPWQAIAELYKTAFQAGLALAAQQGFAKVPDKPYATRTWQDEWHNF